MQKIIFSILIIFILMSESYSCSCANIPKTFAENISEEHVVFKAEILEHIDLGQPSDFSFIYDKITKLKVSLWYQNQMGSDTIYYGSGQSSMCIRSISHLDIGQELILKTLKKSWIPTDPVFNNRNKNPRTDLDQYKEIPLVGYDICDRGILMIENEKVVGSVTKNIPLRKQKFENFLRKFSEGWADKRERKRRERNKQQQISKERFERIIRRKFVNAVG